MIPPLARSAVDRAPEARDRVRTVADLALLGEPRLLVVADGATTVVEDELVLVGPEEAGALQGGPDGAGALVLLGVADGLAYGAVAGTPPRRLGGRVLGLREVGASLSDRDAGLLVTASALLAWHATHRHCPRCGTATVAERGGWVRRCPTDGSEHFPRVDPAMIVLVHDGAGRCLLGRKPEWPPGRYSCLAGFVEPGESVEAAVVREVLEESGVVVRAVRYEASQPWPFPSSLMLAFTAVGGGEPRADGEELEDVRWFDRGELRTVHLPPPASIAHGLITAWAGAAADGP